MTDMVRKQVYIHKRQQALLKRLSSLRGMSESEIIRNAIDREVENRNNTHPLGNSHNALQESIAFALSLRERPFIGEPYRWNREEIYEERENRWVKRGQDKQ
jgi:hypothetical protein